MAQPPGGGGDCERGDVAVPGEVVWLLARGCDGFVGGDGGGVGGGFEFAQDYATLDALAVRKMGQARERYCIPQSPRPGPRSPGTARAISSGTRGRSRCCTSR